MVVSSSGKKNMRSFTVVDARRIDGCKTKFTVRGDTGRYVSRNPAGAAKKAFAVLCRIKRIRGRCALVLTVRETTQGSISKEFTYKLRRYKLPEPVTLPNGRSYEYGTSVKAVKGKGSVSCKSGKGKSSGPMKSKSGKGARVTSSASKTKKTKKSVNKTKKRFTFF